MNTNIYWNPEYNAPRTNFETFKKSQYIVEGVKRIAKLKDWVTIKDPADVIGSLALARQQIQQNLTPEYYQAVMTGHPTKLANSNGFKWDSGIWDYVLNSTAGVLCAVNDVCENGFQQSISLSSGMHHARADRGVGMCTVNSLAIGALYARKAGKVAVLDLDAHWGGGTTRYIKDTNIAQIDLSTSTFDTYTSPEMNADSWVAEADHINYFAKLTEALAALSAVRPDVVLYNAGVDVYPRLTDKQVYEREQIVADYLHGLGCKTVIVMAGGYGAYEHIVPLHLATIMAFSSQTSVLA